MTKPTYNEPSSAPMRGRIRATRSTNRFFGAFNPMERYNHRWMGVVSILSVVMVQLVAMLGQAVNPTPAQAADLPPLSASLHVHGV